MKLIFENDDDIGFLCDEEGDEQSIVMICCTCKNVWQYPMTKKFKLDLKVIASEVCESCDPLHMETVKELQHGKHLGQVPY